MAVDIEKRNKRINAWIKENSERINIMFPMGTKERIQNAAYNKKISASEYVRQAINTALEKDGL